MPRAKTSSRSTSAPSGPVIYRLVLLALLAFGAFVLASLIGFDRADPPSHLVYPPNSPVANWCGPFGAAVAYHLFKLVGLGAWVFVGLLVIGLLSSTAGKLSHGVVRLIGLLMLTAAASGMQNLIFRGTGPLPDLPGGLIGVVGVNELSQRFGSLGSFFWLALLALVGSIVAMDEWITAAFGWTWSWARRRGAPAALAVGKAGVGFAGELASGAARSLARPAEAPRSRGLFGALASMFQRSKPVEVRMNDLDDDQEMPERDTMRARRAKMAAQAVEEDEVAAAPVAVADEESEELEEEDADDSPKLLVVDEDEEEEEYGYLDVDDDAPAPAAKGARPGAAPAAPSADEADDDLPGAPQVFSESALREKISKLPIAFGQRNVQLATDADLKSLQGAADATADDETKPYRFPGLDLLENPEENFNSKLEEYVRDQATALESALRQYRLDGEVVGIESGPVITLYDVRLAPGTKVNQLTAIQSDIARALKAINIRIVPNQAGRDTVGVEVPNAQKEKVRLKELMGKTEKFTSMKLPMFLGKDASGEPLIEDLTKMPHMLIAGTTGSGKSVCMNTIIMGFLYTKKPSELKMVLVDPKMVEMSQFKDIPHLMCPVVTEMSKAAAILEWACTKMDERYELLAEAGCRDIASYNDLPFEELKERFHVQTPEEEARIPRKLPYMVFVIDELADLMMTAKEVESYIIRIAQKARAVGIHLILATQRPQANVVTGLIKSNMPCRISFKVSSGMDSRIVLDQKGGELLLGHGDMLFLSPRSSKLSRAQGTLVDDMEIRKVVRFMRDVAGPSFERQLLTIRTTGDGSGLANLSDEERLLQSQNNSSASLAAAQEDPLFMRAVEIVLETKRGSVSLLQRRLAIGYTRASRLIDLMGIAGIISDHKGSVARDVLIGEPEWNAMKQLAAENGIGVEPKQAELFEEPVRTAYDAEPAAAPEEDEEDESL